VPLECPGWVRFEALTKQRKRPACGYPAERARILRLLTEWVDVVPDGISVTLHAAGIRSLVAELASEQAAAPDPGHAALMEAAE
jgi:hypothetical protein